jgi:glycosyltransferase involved in cell wall biosynthesis
MNKPTAGQPLLSIVVPAYNEEATLSEIVARLLAVEEADEIVIVDDCSTDGTRGITDRLAAEHPRIKVGRHSVNAGKTEALKTGFALTTGQIVIVQDADLEYDPAEIGDVIAPIIEGHADVVYGSRFLVRKASRVLYFYHYLANKGLILAWSRSRRATSRPQLAKTIPRGRPTCPQPPIMTIFLIRSITFLIGRRD